MAFIVQQFAGDNGVQLGCEDLVRPMLWGRTWTKIRVGCRMACNALNTIPYVDSPIMPRVGICTGSQAFLSGTTTDAVWVWDTGNHNSVLAGAGSFTYMSPNGGAVNYSGYQRIGTTNNYLGSFSGGQVLWSCNPTGWRSQFFADFTKTSATQITITLWTPSTAQLVDCTRGNYLASLEADNTGYNVTQEYTGTQTLVRQVFDWDSVFFGWCRAVPSMTFFDLSVIRYF